MSSERPDDVVIDAQGLCKDYPLYGSARERLSHLLWARGREARLFHALRDVSLTLRRGESLGIIGQNGAGKSTLLQLLCGTLTPTSGRLSVHGRVAPLLELGAGFNPEFSGRENIFMNAAVLGLDAAEIRERLDDIIEFADIGDFIDQPVRTYSSGMYVRLAFSIATRISPDILVIDEAIAVGDGQFARKSFDRILALRDAGVTLLFCSHALFQVEALCERALWLHHGEVRALGPASRVVAEYNEWLNAGGDHPQAGGAALAAPVAAPSGHARLTALSVACDGVTGVSLSAESGKSRLDIRFAFASDPALPPPTLAVMIYSGDGRILTSTGTWIDGVTMARDGAGNGRATLTYDPLPLLKGRYSVSAYLMCERGLHVYAGVEHMATLNVTQPHLEQGMVSLPHRWSSDHF
ncbi:MAG: ABC transporter ATP-binding protein [Betaproteobacteria bacterium]|nr:ABC transporter ATP-binding protein [Betaproteobacteria bacterium]